jgi:predicted transcriptional regulator
MVVVHQNLKFAIFPVFLPDIREFRAETGFAMDCVVSQSRAGGDTAAAECDGAPGAATCRTTPRLRRLSVSRLTTPPVKLHNEEGMSADDIAARFGVTPAVVKQRLKLGAVSPKLMALYRKDEMSLDQLSAVAITEDHEKQERVWKELRSYHRNREAILRALSEGQVHSDGFRSYCGHCT